MAKVPNGVETLPKISIAWVGCTNVTDDRQTTDGRTTTYSEREPLNPSFSFLGSFILRSTVWILKSGYGPMWPVWAFLCTVALRARCGIIWYYFLTYIFILSYHHKSCQYWANNRYRTGQNHNDQLHLICTTGSVGHTLYNNTIIWHCQI